MATINAANVDLLKKLQETIRTGIMGVKSFEAASQRYTNAIYDTFQESIILVRQFTTVPYNALPGPNKAFVDRLAASKGVSSAMHDHTLVLSLLGTSGANPEWNDRARSQGHIGIPLASVAFIDAIPMMSRLLKQLGLGLDWIDSQDTQLVKKTMGSMGGVFFVPDAVTEVDQRGRKIIAAQDFVKAYHVKSVFGFGGGYLGTRTFAVTIIFLREAIDKGKAGQIAAALATFKASTVNLVKTKIFA